jgi:hypothetical protein
MLFHPSLIFAGKAAACQSGALTELHSTGRLVSLPENIGLVKYIAVANTLAYNDTPTITAIFLKY